MEELNIPPLKNIIHVAGTNGKGSTIAFLENILLSHGYKSNVYTSPHLISFNERIKLKNSLISDSALLSLLQEIKDLLCKKNLENTLSFFEIFTLAALYKFSQNDADFNIIEVGLGGRLDATNIVENPLCSILTSISLDHTEFLGNSINSIAFEKCEIIKKNTIAICAKQNFPEVYDTFEKKCNEIHIKNATIYNKHFMYSLNSDFSFQLSIQNKNVENSHIIFPSPSLKGEMQYENASTALMAFIEIFKKLNIPTCEQKMTTGICTTNWSGRIQKITQGKLFNFLLPSSLTIDGCHNEGGFEKLFNYIKASGVCNYNLVIGLLKRKLPTDIIKVIASNQKYCKQIIITGINTTEEFWNPEELKEIMKPYFNIPIICINSVSEISIKIQPNQDTIICGSLFLMGEILRDYC